MLKYLYQISTYDEMLLISFLISSKVRIHSPPNKTAWFARRFYRPKIPKLLHLMNQFNTDQICSFFHNVLNFL